MQNRLFKITAGLATLVALGLGGTALASAQTPATQPPAATVQHAAEQGATANGVVEQEKGTVDNDAVQEENGADDATEVGQPESKGAEQESATEVPGDDGPGGHADEPGNPNADHQFEGQE